MQVAIDGPSGAGKSTLAKALANQFRFTYIDTGAMYRAVGLFVLRKGLDTKDAEAVGGVLDEIEIEITHDASGQQIWLLGENVSDKIRTPEVSLAASDVSAIPAVRLKLVELQRKLAQKCDVIMDGRDIGTYVLPSAPIKIFLTASDEDRAKRRYDELLAKGQEVTYEDVLKDMRYRDQNDSSRAFAPLKPAEDAVLVDTSGNTFEESYDLLYQLIKERMS